jgi:hypothetical protein
MKQYTFFKYFLIVGALLALCASASAVNRTLIAADDGGIAFDETYTSPSYFYEAKISGDNITTGALASAVYLVGIDSASSPVIVLQPNHNDWGSKQGGTAAQYYHLTADQHTSATQNATGSLPGILSAADWTDFDSKADGDHTHTEFDALAVDSLDVGSGDAPTSGIGAAGDIVTSGVLRGASLNMGGTEIVTSGRALQNVTANASIITAGTLGLDRFSAYDDLTTESKIGTGSAQVAAGDHIHATYAAKADYTSNTLIVAKSGGQYTTIQGAVDAASDGYTILIYPGTYTLSSAITCTKSVGIVGVDRDKCIIEMVNAKVGAIGYGDGVINLQSGTIAISNLTIRNTEATTGVNTSPVILTTSGTITLRNLYLGGNGGRDVLCVLGTTSMVCDNVQVDQYNAGSSAEHVIWVATSASLVFERGKCTTAGTGGGVQIDTSGDVTFRYTYFNSTSYVIDSDACDVLTVEFCKMLSGGFFSTSTYNSLVCNFNDFGTVTAGGDLVADGAFYGAESSAGSIFKLDINGGGDAPVIEMGYPTETPSVVFDVNLYRGGADELKTDDAFNANSLKIGGTEVVTSGRVLQNVTADASIITAGTLNTSRFSAYDDLTTESKIGTGSTQVAAGDHTHTTLDALAVDSLAVGGADAPSSGVGALGDIATSGSVRAASAVLTTADINGGTIDGAVIGGGTAAAGTFTSLSGTSTLWKDWAAVSAVLYDRGWILFMTGDASASGTFYRESFDASTYLKSEYDGTVLYFPIPYNAGTILTQLRVKWQAEGNNDGVKVRLLKRDESGTNTAWTVVGAQQTYVDSGTPFPVTVSTYDFADETMSANHSYVIEIEAKVVTAGVKLYSIGLESSKRVY